jgi:hypothetical protein
MNADALWAFLSLIALVLLFYGPWQGICTDIARQIVFEQRDRLFDMANNGRISFASKEYRDIRSGLESLIRFAHDLTLPHAIYLALVLPQVRYERLENSILVAISRVKDESLQRDLLKIVSLAYLAVILMAICKSAIGLLLAPVIIVSAIWAFFVKRKAALCRQYVFKIGRVIQVEAECG